MRKLSAAAKAAVKNDYFVLVDLDLNNEYYRYTSLPYGVQYNGQTYTADNGVFQFDEPHFSNIVDREAYKIGIVDHDDIFKNEFELGVFNRPIKIQIGWLDDNGDPLLDDGDLMLGYQGYIDNPRRSIRDEEKLVTIEATSPMADLDRVNTVITSSDSVKQINAADTSFDSIYEGRDVILRWGKD